MKRFDRLVIACLALWLVVWIVLSWAAIQDDALIHLRYADFLYRVHFITYDGVHPSYGTSSLLYVGLLALLRSMTQSPLLSRAVSTIFHILLFAGLATFYLRHAATVSSRVRLLMFSLLLLVVVPSSVRWLDDGMETGLVLCLVSVVAWQTHRLSSCDRTSARDFAACATLGFSLVFLRTELASVALLASAILLLATISQGPHSRRPTALFGRTHFFAGALLAALLIRIVMHSFLPDTALAKSHGAAAFVPALRAAATVLTGALLFGVGLCALWLVSAAVVLRERRVRLLPTLAANALFLLILSASALRGQEIQGARYLVWCFVFSIVWNALELWRIDAPGGKLDAPSAPRLVFAVFLALCILFLPVESRLMYRVLSTRAHTMKEFTREDLASPLRGQLGVAGDVGYISYFSHDYICDLAGLVNGRAAAALSATQRLQVCAAMHPAFAFVNASQANALAEDLNLRQWRMCGEYDFGNLRVPDRHFLLVEPQLAEATCHATGYQGEPASTAFTESTYQ